MNEDQALENARTVASLLELEDEQAAEKLESPIQITWDTSDDSAARLGAFVVRLLARTFLEIGNYSCPRANASVELLINGAARLGSAETTLHCQIDAASFSCGPLPSTPRDVGSTVPDVLCLVAACFASAQVTHYVLQLPSGRVSPQGVHHNFATWPGVPLDVWETEVDLGELQFAGGGAVGNAVLFAQQFLPVRGQGVMIDPKRVVPGILNRCLWFDTADLDKDKATALVYKLEEAKSRIVLRPLCRTVSQARGEVPNFDCLVVGVDSRRSRRNLQGELPLEVFDASTTGVDEVVFHHNRLFTGGACLACIYKEMQAEKAFAEHVAELLNVTAAEVAEEFISRAAAAKICERYPDVKPDGIAGKAYTTIFRQQCATGSLVTPEQKQVLAPFAFVSQLAGTILAIEMFLRRIDPQRGRVFNYWRVNPWRGILIDLQDYRMPDLNCTVCSKQDYQDAARLAWKL